jgi:hypothetical protein
MATIEEIIGHPLTLLLIGASVSSLLIPWFTNKWQDHRKKLDIKIELVSKMTEDISYQIGNATMSLWLKKQEFTDAEKDTFWEKEKKSFINASVIRSRL